MQHSVWIIGALVCLLGITVVLRPDWMKKSLDFLALGQRFRLAVAVKIIAGVVFLVFARECRISWLIFLFGILTAGGSILAIVALKPESILAWIAWWQKKPFWLFRLWGIAATIIGLVIIYAGIPA